MYLGDGFRFCVLWVFMWLFPNYLMSLPYIITIQMGVVTLHVRVKLKHVVQRTEVGYLRSFGFPKCVTY